MKQAVKEGAKRSGIMTINKGIAADVEKLYQKYVSDALAQGVDLDTLGPEQLKMIVAMNAKATNRVISGSSAEGRAITEKLFGKKGEVVEFPQKTSFKEQVEAMKKSGDIVDPNNLKKNDNVLKREMFNNSNLNKAALDRDRAIKAKARIEEKNEETIMDRINKANNRINQAQKEIDEMYRPKTDAEIKAKFDKQNQESIQRFKDKMKKDEPDDMATGGRAGFYTGGITDVEPSLDDIGHGSDSLMSRTRLMSPGSQATTSTGLNYLLAEDNDNLRVPFKGGGLTPEDYLKVKDMLNHYHKYKKSGKPKISKADFGTAFFRENNAEGGRIGLAGGGGRRAFLKMLGLTGAGIAGLKSGLFGTSGKEATKKAVTETVKQSAGSGTPPPYFFKLVEKIKTMGDDVTPGYATKDRQVVKQYKDFELTEDIATGEQTIQRKRPSDFEYYDEQLYEDVYMNYKPGKGQADETTKGIPADEYVEDTSYIRTSGSQKGDVYDTVDGVPDDVIQEGTMFEDNMTEFGKTKKADGGRIGFRVGGSGKKFLEKVFGKGSLDEMIKRDPGMHRGLLEVVEMFRNRDKEGLKMYMQKFLPHMDDTEIEEFIIGDAVDSAGQAKFGLGDMSGQLIRLGSGRDYKAKIDMIKQADNMRELDKLDVKGRKPNASGGLQTMLGE